MTVALNNPKTIITSRATINCGIASGNCHRRTVIVREMMLTETEMKLILLFQSPKKEFHIGTEAC